MIARYAPEPSTQSVRLGNVLKPPRATAETVSDRAVMALGMLLVPLIAFGVVFGISLIVSAG